MADSTDNPSSSTDTRRVRGPTLMKKINKVLQTGEKMQVEFDTTTNACIGINAPTYTSYVASLARQKCSILKNEWKEIDDGIKNAIWVDVQNPFTIPEDSDPKHRLLKRECIKQAGEQWRAFKTHLTRHYIRNPKKDQLPPYIKYNFIKEEDWKKFVESRESPEFKIKSQKGAANVARNVYPHILSRGGYRLLEEKIMNEKRSSTDESTVDDTSSPSLPPRHELWKRARIKKGGDYTSQATQVVVEKIDSLVQDAESGSFVQDGCHDILTAAIGTSEHGGRVRGVGKHHKKSTFFGRQSTRQRQEQMKEQISSELESKFRAELEKRLLEERKAMQESFMETLRSMGLSQQSNDNNNKVMLIPEAVDGSGKESCSVAKLSIKEGEGEGEGEREDPIERLMGLVNTMGDFHVKIDLSHTASTKSFFMPLKCINEFVVGSQWLDISVLQVWSTYIHNLCIDTSKSQVYGILDPAMCVYYDGDLKSQTSVKLYIQNMLRDETRNCHLLPFIHGGHWQLIVICPRDNTVVVLCSLHYQLNKTMTKLVKDALAVYEAANGNRKKATWLQPKTRKHPNANDCGYYVMKHMLDIVSANITDFWMTVFNDQTSLTEDDLNDLRRRWGTCFFELFKG